MKGKDAIDNSGTFTPLSFKIRRSNILNLVYKNYNHHLIDNSDVNNTLLTLKELFKTHFSNSIIIVKQLAL